MRVGESSIFITFNEDIEEEFDNSFCCEASNGTDENLRRACEVYSVRNPDEDTMMYADGVCTKKVAYDDTTVGYADFFFTIPDETVIRYEDEMATLDQCCLASYENESEELGDQLLGACSKQTISENKYYFEEDLCANYQYTVDVWSTSYDYAVKSETISVDYEIVDKDDCCLYSNEGDYNLEVCDSYQEGAISVSYDVENNMCV